MSSSVLAIVVYWVGALGDWYFTKRAVIDPEKGLRKGLPPLGIKEGNPVVGWILDHFGEWGLLFLKILFFWLLYDSGAPSVLMYVAGLLYMAAGYWNRRLIKQVEKRRRT